MKTHIEQETSNKFSMDENETLTHYVIVIRFFPSTNSYSFNAPCNWEVRRLRKFIISSFEEDLNYSKFALLYKANQLANDDILLKDLFELNQVNNLNLVLTNINNNNQKEKEKEKENVKEQNVKTKFEIFQSKDFGLIENEVFENYFQSIEGDHRKVDFAIFPFAHRNISQRIEMINSTNALENLRAYEPQKIENFPLKNFFQLDLLFKLLLLMILLSHYFVKWNFPIFISVLFIYYWHILTNLINEHYRKKIEELNINQDDLNDNQKFAEERHFDNTVPLQDDNNKDEENEKENEEDNDGHNKSIHDIERIIEEKIEQFKQDLKEDNKDVKDKAKDVSIVCDLKDLTNKSKKERKEILKEIHYKKIEEKFGNTVSEEFKDTIRKQIDTVINDDKDIESIQSNQTKSLNDHQQQQKQHEIPQNETLPQYIVSLIFEVVYSFIITLVPAWCEAFELNHPIPGENIHNNPIGPNNNEPLQQQQQQEQVEQQQQYHNEESINKENPISNHDTNSQQQDCPKSKEEVKIISSNNSEKVHLPSSHLINQSEEQNQNVRYKILKPTDSKTIESEYIFNENFNIDNISNNEALFEFQKPKNDNEEEEDKKNK